MKVPHHTNSCRQGWGCHPDCPVLALTEQYEALLKAQPKDPDNDNT
jgi:hypothetical protein